MTEAPIKTMPFTDPLATILMGCRGKDPSSQEKLYRYCYPDVIRICLRYAGDMDGAGTIFNNAMIRVFKSLNDYEDQGKFMGWVKTITVNCCLDFVRQQHKFREATQELTREDDIGIPEDVFGRISAKDIQGIVRQLPRATAVVFNLFIYEGFTHKQIAAALGISDGTSKWHVNEARKILKKRLEEFINPAINQNAI